MPRRAPLGHPTADTHSAHALTANTHLRELDCRFNELSDAFERDRLAPALAALAARAELDA